MVGIVVTVLMPMHKIYVSMLSTGGAKTQPLNTTSHLDMIWNKQPIYTRVEISSQKISYSDCRAEKKFIQFCEL